jgi:hypothetical protein
MNMEKTYGFANLSVLIDFEYFEMLNTNKNMYFLLISPIFLLLVLKSCNFEKVLELGCWVSKMLFYVFPCYIFVGHNGRR